MKNAHKPVKNDVSGLPKQLFGDWDEFEATLASYVAKNYLCFRVRSSETRSKHNRYICIMLLNI